MDSSQLHACRSDFQQHIRYAKILVTEGFESFERAANARNSVAPDLIWHLYKEHKHKGPAEAARAIIEGGRKVLASKTDQPIPAGLRRELDDTMAAIENSAGQQDICAELRKALAQALEWIDAVPRDTPLPAMPGFDRDYVDELLDRSRK